MNLAGRQNSGLLIPTKLMESLEQMMAPENNIYQDDWTQRLKENPSDPLEDIRQEHEGFLTQLEALAVGAIAIGDWSRVRDLINDFKDYQDDANADSVDNSGAGSLPTSAVNERKD